MEGRLKSRFPEKCKSCIWGRFPSQFWPHFGAMLAPQMHFLQKKKLLEISQKKKRTPQVSNNLGAGQTESRMAPRKPPLAHALFQTRNSCLSNCYALFWICCKKRRSRRKQREKIIEKFKSSVQLVRVLTKVDQNLLKKVFGLLEQMLLLWIHEVVGEVAASSWNKTQCPWSDTPWAKARWIF